jgi:hypothetical protein
MTIRQLKDRCWHLDPPPEDERDPHYDNRHDADDALRDLREERGPDPLDLAALESCHAKQLDGPCWVVQCDGECEVELDTEDEGYTYHHDSPEAAMETVGAYGWTVTTGPVSGVRVYCPEDRPEDTVPAPPTVAELEAAGQLRLPGVA